MTVKLVTATGAAKTGTVKVPEATLSDAGVSRVVRATLANEQRERPLAKTRGLVRGGGAKPWRQKGTGRARAGSNRSPIWRGGGVTFGPSGEPRAYKRLPRAMRQAALGAVLGKLAEADRLTVVSGALSLPKSKDAATLFAKIVPEQTALCVVTVEESEKTKGVRNLADVELTTVSDCTVADLIRYDQAVFSEAAFKALTETGDRPVRRSAANSQGGQPRQRTASVAKPVAAKKPAPKKETAK